MTWLDAARIAAGVAIVGLLVLLLVAVVVAAARAEHYRSRGCRVTYPSWSEDFFGDVSIRVEVPEDFVTEHEWLDAGLKFERRGDAREKRS